MAGSLINTMGGFSQVGIVVTDIDKTMRHMTETLGIGPFFVLRKIALDNFKYRGKPSASPILDVAMAQSGPVQIELIQPLNDVPSAYKESLAAGREGFQHLSVWFSDSESYNRAYDKLAAKLTIIQEGGTRSRHAYFESEIPGGFMLEISESMQPATRHIADNATKAALEWDGSDPIRVIKLG